MQACPPKLSRAAGGGGAKEGLNAGRKAGFECRLKCRLKGRFEYRLKCKSKCQVKRPVGGKKDNELDFNHEAKPCNPLIRVIRDSDDLLPTISCVCLKAEAINLEEVTMTSGTTF